MLIALGVRGALVGHSERRQYFGETDIDVARRAEAALEAGLGVIACVGETQEERDAGDTEEVLRIQVGAIDDECGEDDRLVLAYEPVWAIGTGRTATPELAQDAHAFIKSLLDRPVLYGGSVKPENAAELMAQAGRRRCARRRRLARHRLLRRDMRSGSDVPARSARHPRRLGMRAAGPRQRGRARGDAGVRPALGRVLRTRRSRRPARRSGCPPARWATPRSAT